MGSFWSDFFNMRWKTITWFTFVISGFTLGVISLPPFLDRLLMAAKRKEFITKFPEYFVPLIIILCIWFAVVALQEAVAEWNEAFGIVYGILSGVGGLIRLRAEALARTGGGGGSLTDPLINPQTGSW